MPSTNRPPLPSAMRGRLLGEERRTALEDADDAGAEPRRSSVHAAANASGVKPSGPLVSPDHRSV